MPAMTRGPLSARTYWVRRILVFGTAVLLVFAIGRMLGGGSDGSDGDDTARLTGETPSSSAPASTGTSTAPSPTDRATRRPGKGRRTSEAPVLATPTGPCVGSDIVVEPVVRNAVAGRDVMVVLQLRTISSEACTWRSSPDALTLNITSGQDRIWTSRDCPRAVPRRDVVVRKAVTTKVGVVWTQAKRSDAEGCTARTDWAQAGLVPRDRRGAGRRAVRPAVRADPADRGDDHEDSDPEADSDSDAVREADPQGRQQAERLAVGRGRARLSRYT